MKSPFHDPTMPLLTTSTCTQANVDDNVLSVCAENLLPAVDDNVPSVCAENLLPAVDDNVPSV